MKLCIFDLDGTTVNSLPSIAYFANSTLKHFGYPPFSETDYCFLAGGGTRSLWENIRKERGIPSSLLSVIMQDWLDRYSADALYLSRPYPGIRELFLSLRAHRIRTAILTNKAKEIAEKMVESLFGPPGECIDVLISDHPGMALKPSPKEILSLMEHFSVSPEECMYCGDHHIDMEMAVAAGIAGIGVTWGFHTREVLLSAGAVFVAETPGDILQFALTHGKIH